MTQDDLRLMQAHMLRTIGAVKRPKPQAPPCDIEPRWPYAVLLTFGIVITLTLIVAGAEKLAEVWGL
jgi:hypothetical protein